MGRSLMKNAYNLGVLSELKEALGNLASSPVTCLSWNRTQVWVTAAWAAWPPAIWIP